MLDKILNYRLKSECFYRQTTVLHICGYYFPLKGNANGNTPTHSLTHSGQTCRSDKNRNGENGKWNENIFISFINVNEALSLEQFWLQRGTEQLQGIYHHDVTSCQDWGGWGTVGLQRAKECRGEKWKTNEEDKWDKFDTKWNHWFGFF